MAVIIEKLSTDFVDDVIDTSANLDRVYDIKETDGTIVKSRVTLDEVTEYLRQGSTFGADVINHTHTIINEINDKLADGGISMVDISEWETMSDDEKKAKNYFVLDGDTGKLYINGVETSGASIKLVDRATWNDMSDEEKAKGVYFVERDNGYYLTADIVAYTSSKDVRQALDEISESLNEKANQTEVDGLTESLTHYEAGTITPSFAQGTTSLVFAENAFMYAVSGIVTFNTDVVANTFYNIDLSSYMPKRMQTSMPSLGVYAGATQIGQGSINSQGILSFRLNTTRQSGSQIGVHAFCLKKMP